MGTSMMAWFMTWAVECIVKLFIGLKNNMKTKTRDENVFPRVFTDIVCNADRVEEIVAKESPALQEEAVRFALYQRLDYLLHIPVPMMTKNNDFYVKVCNYLKKHRRDIRKNAYLTKKNRQYLLLLSYAPAFVRKVHKTIKKWSK